MLKLDSPYRRKEARNLVLAGQERISAEKVINYAWLYADKVAHDFGFGLQYTLLTFKGLYHYASRDSQPPRCHIYPVPNLKHPFLGVHFTRTLDGQTKIGPTVHTGFVARALWRVQRL